MKAAQIQTYGGPDSIHVDDNAPEPTLKENHVLVEIHAAALNPFDAKIRSGMYKEMIPLQFPVTLGGDFSGTVLQTGGGVSDYKIGDEVFGTAIVMTGGSGAFAQKASANIKSISKKPHAVNHLEAASLVLVGVSAIQALEQHINLQSGQKILIHGGAGGIGSAAIQLAKSKGAYVATTASGDGIAFVKDLGADEVIDYKNGRFEDKLNGYDAVYDTVGGDTTDRSFAVLKHGGVIVSMVGQPNQEKAKELGVIAVGQMTKTNTENLRRLAELIEAGTIKPQIDSVYTLEEVQQAFTHLEQGHPRGKVVLQIK